jgi:putative thioredoxin
MDVTTETFDRDVIERALGPALEDEVAKRAGGLELAKIDVDAEPVLAGRYGIQSIPTVVVFRDGSPVTGFVGAHPAAAIGKFLDTIPDTDVTATAASA